MVKRNRSNWKILFRLPTGHFCKSWKEFVATVKVPSGLTRKALKSRRTSLRLYETEYPIFLLLGFGPPSIAAASAFLNESRISGVSAPHKQEDVTKMEVICRI